MIHKKSWHREKEKQKNFHFLWKLLKDVVRAITRDESERRREIHMSEGNVMLERWCFAPYSTNGALQLVHSSSGAFRVYRNSIGMFAALDRTFIFNQRRLIVYSASGTCADEPSIRFRGFAIAECRECCARKQFLSNDLWMFCLSLSQSNFPINCKPQSD